MHDAIVLAGGSARRLDGAAKPQLVVGGVRLLDRVVAAAGARLTVVVGPVQPVATPVVWARESPPGGGPVAALAAAQEFVRADVCLVLAADLPWLGPAVPRLLDAVPAAGVALLVSPDGRRNHLAGAWRTSALRARLAALSDPAGASMRALLAGVPVAEVADDHGWGRDCDTWDDLRQAREEARMTDRLTEWTDAVCAELGLDPAVVDRDLVLDLARDVAHGVARPAAPLTAFLVGLAAAGSPDVARELAARVTALAQRTSSSPE